MRNVLRILVGVAVSMAVLETFALFTHGLGADLRGGFIDPAHLIRAGLSPYPGLHAPLGPTPSDYLPPLIVSAGLPLSFLPLHAATLVWTVLLVGCMGGALWLMGVRDWRCYVFALASSPFLTALGFGNPTPVVVLLVAAAYRWRQSPLVSGITLGAAAAVKPFVLPMLLWRGVTKATVIGAATFVSLTVAAWAAIGFRGLSTYPALLHRVSDARGANGSSLYAAALHLGRDSRLALLVSVGAALAVLAVGRGSFESAVLASLLASPLIWSHYFALLYLVVAVQSPRFSARWLIGLCYVPVAVGGGPLLAGKLILGIAGAAYICTVPPGSVAAARVRLIRARAQTSVA